MYGADVYYEVEAGKLVARVERLAGRVEAIVQSQDPEVRLRVEGKIRAKWSRIEYLPPVNRLDPLVQQMNPLLEVQYFQARQPVRAGLFGSILGGLF